MKPVLLLAVLLAAPALAQTPPATIGQSFIPAPWWMKEPVIASMGHVRTEVPANRAHIGARFKKVEKTAGEALSAVAAQVRALDAARRARDAVAAAGARLGPVKINEPSGRVCQTQVLAGWPSYGSAPPARDVIASAPASDASEQSIMVTGAKRATPASLEERADALQVTLQPPLRELTAQSCVIYGLLPPG
jgi:cell pole-organizing protein PopZ